MTGLIQYLGSAFLGWSLGANDSANVFGTAVSSRMVSFRLAVWLTAAFVIVGALCQGGAGVRTLSQELRRPRQELQTPAARTRAVKNALVISLSAALTVTLMTLKRLPVSTSQAVVGAIVGVGSMQGNVRLAGLGKVVLCWIGTPVGGFLVGILLYLVLKRLLRWWRPSVFAYDPVMALLLILCGCYGAYALGANNVANVSAMFVAEDLMSVRQAVVFGAVTIAAGALTYAKPVMMTVGRGIVRLDAFTALVCVAAHAVTVHFYAMVGVPVSTSQAIVGAVLGVGFLKGTQTINFRELRRICFGWFLTPLAAALLAALGHVVSNLRYLPA